jgi:hypothetical protein
MKCNKPIEVIAQFSGSQGGGILSTHYCALDPGHEGPCMDSQGRIEPLDIRKKPDKLNFPQWWAEYHKGHKEPPIGGSEWMLAYAAWHYALAMSEHK